MKDKGTGTRQGPAGSNMTKVFTNTGNTKSAKN